jgi:hypothetical protein
LFTFLKLEKNVGEKHLFFLMMSVKEGSMQHDTTDFENEIVDVLIEKICLVYKHVRLKITFPTRCGKSQSSKQKNVF